MNSPNRRSNVQKGMSKLHIHALQHVWFEDLANIKRWAKRKDYSITETLLFDQQALPSPKDFDWLVVMGGPMNVYEEKKYPWLIQEKKLIEKAIATDKLVLGICLGAQLIADVLGGSVSRNAHKEIGWHPVTLTGEAKQSFVFRVLSPQFVAFHWHGDTFALPRGCKRMASSEGCVNQAFEYNNRVIGLQFHLESSVESVRRLIQNCSKDLANGKYVQTADVILSRLENVRTIERIINQFLDQIQKMTTSGE